MSKQDVVVEQKIPFAPLLERLEGIKGAKAGFARQMGVSDAVVSNWIKRDSIPLRRLAKALKAVRMSEEEYQAASGLLEEVVKIANMEPASNFSRLAKAFLALPKGLQSYIARKTEELASFSSAMPAYLRDGINPPDDQEEYWKWEESLRQDMRTPNATRPSTPPGTNPKKR